MQVRFEELIFDFWKNIRLIVSNFVHYGSTWALRWKHLVSPEIELRYLACWNKELRQFAFAVSLHDKTDILGCFCTSSTTGPYNFCEKRGHMVLPRYFSKVAWNIHLGLSWLIFFDLFLSSLVNWSVQTVHSADIVMITNCHVSK